MNMLRSASDAAAFSSPSPRRPSQEVLSDEGDNREFFDQKVLLGISPKLQRHVTRGAKELPSSVFKKKTFGMGKKGRNIFQELRNEHSQISLGGQFGHMSGVDPSEYDAAWLLTGVHRWRNDASAPESTSKDDLRSVTSLKSKVGAGASSVKERNNSVVPTSNVGGAWGKRSSAPAAQLSMTSPKITVDTASEAGSIFSLQMCSKVHFYPDDVGVPVKFMVCNDTESMLISGHKNGRVKIWNLNSHPLSAVGTYNGHYTPNAPMSPDRNGPGGVFCGGFLRDSSHAMTCDGVVKVWDIETQKTLVDLQPSSLDPTFGLWFTHAEVVSTQNGIVPDIGPHGDNMVMACLGSTLYHFDVRVRTTGILSAVAEWRLPVPSSSAASGVSDMPLPGRSAGAGVMGGSLIGSGNIAPPPCLTSCISHNNVIYAGTSQGFIISMDRRSGKPIITWQGHSGPVVKVSLKFCSVNINNRHAQLCGLEKHHLLSISDKSARIWEHQKGKLKLLQPIKGLPESSLGMNANTIILNSYEQLNSFSDTYSSFNKPIYALYCLSGHKMCAGRIPITSQGEFVEKINLAQLNKEVRFVSLLFIILICSKLFLYEID
jgi:hypothetical protein